MKNVLFPGKFQPPHLGHIITIMKLRKDYNKIIIGITEDKPEVMPQSKRKKIFDDVFKGFIDVETVIIKGTIEGCSSLKNLPEFDVCISGNKNVIKKIREFGKEAKFIKRSFPKIYSGTRWREDVKSKTRR